jgi:tRNA pseudouridine55 synthase
MDGVIVIDKPEGWTSHDVVARARRILKTKRIGHLGTLDPIATGVLPLVIERATRLAQFYTRSDKVYEGVVRFGWSTDSYDRAGVPTSERTEPRIDAAALEAEVERFRGEFRQAPPPVSAKKVNGQRAYELARRSVAVELEPVPVHVYELTVLGIEGSLVTLRAHCSGGTYIRSIAHELGCAMGCDCGASPAGSSASNRRGPWRNWKPWRPMSAWWTRWCRRANCFPAFPACTWTIR